MIAGTVLMFDHVKHKIFIINNILADKNTNLEQEYENTKNKVREITNKLSFTQSTELKDIIYVLIWYLVNTDTCEIGLYQQVHFIYLCIYIYMILYIYIYIYIRKRTCVFVINIGVPQSASNKPIRTSEETAMSM